MTAREFTEAVAKGNMGLLSNVAQNCLNDGRIDEHIQMWLEQDEDPVSRKTVIRTLGNELYQVLQSFKSNKLMGDKICIDRLKCDNFPDCKTCEEHFKKM